MCFLSTTFPNTPAHQPPPPPYTFWPVPYLLYALFIYDYILVNSFSCLSTVVEINCCCCCCWWYIAHGSFCFTYQQKGIFQKVLCDICLEKTSVICQSEYLVVKRVNFSPTWISRQSPERWGKSWFSDNQSPPCSEAVVALKTFVLL